MQLHSGYIIVVENRSQQKELKIERIALLIALPTAI
jgi:hypothetical protein